MRFYAVWTVGQDIGLAILFGALISAAAVGIRVDDFRLVIFQVLQNTACDSDKEDAAIFLSRIWKRFAQSRKLLLQRSLNGLSHAVGKVVNVSGFKLCHCYPV